MDGPGDEILTHAAFPKYQDRRISVGDVLDDRPDCPHLRASVEKRDVVGEVTLSSVTVVSRVTVGGVAQVNPVRERVWGNFSSVSRDFVA